MRAPVSIVWFRRDLRLADNPALRAAIDAGGPIIPVFIWSPDEERRWAPGAASRWWLHRSLGALDADLRSRGSRLIFLRGPSLEALRAVATASGARSVFYNRMYEPAAAARDREVTRGLERDGTRTAGFNAALLFEPWEISNASGGPYQVYTPFWRACIAAPDRSDPGVAPRGTIPAPAEWPRSQPLRSLDIDPRAAWTGGLQAAWNPGEAAALRRLDQFVGASIEDYGEQRDRPDIAGTARLSPHLHFGEIGPRQIWSALRRLGSRRSGATSSIPRDFERQIVWREFACHLLHHFPHTTERPLRQWFTRFPHRAGGEALAAWQKGRTGFPIVDAGMRELWSTGWMHNRVRMVVASFLVKDLLVPWQTGAAWFWDTLVDADLANNSLGWQWAAGCGADAAPFFRIFNPVRQGMRFDPDGAYVRRFIPEIARLPARWIHRPFAAPAGVLAEAGVRLGTDYPRPIVDHDERRALALAAYRSAIDPRPAAARQRGAR